MKAITFATEGLQCVCSVCSDELADTLLKMTRLVVSELYSDCFKIQDVKTNLEDAFAECNNVWVVYWASEDIGLVNVTHIGVFADSASAIEYANKVAHTFAETPFTWEEPDVKGYIGMGWDGYVSVECMTDGEIDDYEKIKNACH